MDDPCGPYLLRSLGAASICISIATWPRRILIPAGSKKWYCGASSSFIPLPPGPPCLVFLHGGGAETSFTPRGGTQQKTKKEKKNAVPLRALLPCRTCPPAHRGFSLVGRGVGCGRLLEKKVLFPSDFNMPMLQKGIYRCRCSRVVILL